MTTAPRRQGMLHSAHFADDALVAVSDHAPALPDPAVLAAKLLIGPTLGLKDLADAPAGRDGAVTAVVVSSLAWVKPVAKAWKASVLLGQRYLDGFYSNDWYGGGWVGFLAAARRLVSAASTPSRARSCSASSGPSLPDTRRAASRAISMPTPCRVRADALGATPRSAARPSAARASWTTAFTRAGWNGTAARMSRMRAPASGWLGSTCKASASVSRSRALRIIDDALWQAVKAPPGREQLQHWPQQHRGGAQPGAPEQVPAQRLAAVWRLQGGYTVMAKDRYGCATPPEQEHMRQRPHHSAAAAGTPRAVRAQGPHARTRPGGQVHARLCRGNGGAATRVGRRVSAPVARVG